MTGLLLAVLLATDGGVPPDAGGLTFSDGLYASCPDAKDAPATQLDGGWFLPEVRAQRVACLMATCETARRGEKEIAATPPYWWVAASVAVVGALATGIGVGILVEKAKH